MKQRQQTADVTVALRFSQTEMPGALEITFFSCMFSKVVYFEENFILLLHLQQFVVTSWS